MSLSLLRSAANIAAVRVLVVNRGDFVEECG